jgi:choline dehydrogenase-like flavoprotein
MNEKTRAQVLVVGSGAGGAVTALELAERGLDVTILEEGTKHDLADYGRPAPEAMKRLYRRSGMTPILGRPPIGFVEGACVGGSTEINSGFWHRTPREVLLRWNVQFDLQCVTPDELAEHFEWAERMLGVGLSRKPWPKSTEIFSRGAELMGWHAQEVPRAAPGCMSTNACASGCPTGKKQGMSRKILPAAISAGARLVPNCRAQLLLRRGNRVTGVIAEHTAEDGERSLVSIAADHVFVCAGATQTPSLLRRSGIKFRVGDTLRIHPMLKVMARFDEHVGAAHNALPVLQVKEFGPDISLGGGFFSAGHAAMILGDNGCDVGTAIADVDHLAAYYVAVRGTGRGKVRPSAFDPAAATIRYDLSDEDVRHLSVGLARLSTLLVAAGAREVVPSVFGAAPIRTEKEAIRWLDERLSRSAMSLTTVHAFSSCPAGERADRCTVDSFGKVRSFENLYVNDASMLPDSPGINPQGTIMALARRNAIHFEDRLS